MLFLGRKVSFGAGVVLTALSLVQSPTPVRAESSTAPAAIAPAPEEGGLATFNRFMHDFNESAWDFFESTGSSMRSNFWPDWTVPDNVRTGLSNFVANLINEPTTMISWAVAGDYDMALTSAQRFWVNTTRGWLGFVDVASEEGIAVDQIDIGLALCARGVGEGGYIVLPFIGPRTFRDGLSDFVLVNAMTYAALTPIIGFPPSPRAFVTVEVGEEVARIAIIRQIDHADDRNKPLEAVRDEYLRIRRERCQQVIENLTARQSAE